MNDELYDSEKKNFVMGSGNVRLFQMKSIFLLLSDVKHNIAVVIVSYHCISLSVAKFNCRDTYFKNILTRVGQLEVTGMIHPFLTLKR